MPLNSRLYLKNSTIIGFINSYFSRLVKKSYYAYIKDIIFQVLILLALNIIFNI